MHMPLRIDLCSFVMSPRTSRTWVFPKVGSVLYDRRNSETPARSSSCSLSCVKYSAVFPPQDISTRLSYAVWALKISDRTSYVFCAIGL